MGNGAEESGFLDFISSYLIMEGGYSYKSCRIMSYEMSIPDPRTYYHEVLSDGEYVPKQSPPPLGHITMNLIPTQKTPLSSFSPPLGQQ